MVSIGYTEAAVEVLDILKHTRKEDVQKIPKTFIEFLEKNKSTTYKSNLDHNKSIKEMNLRPKTHAILGIIYMKYWANEFEKEEFKNKVSIKENNYREELQNKYNTDNIFKQSNTTSEMNLPAKIKNETFLQKLINKIKNIFRR